MSDDNRVLGSYLLIAILLFLYFIPSIHANNRKHPNLNSIVLLNLLLGWTLLGWVAAMVWAASALPPIEPIKPKSRESSGKYDDLDRLAELKAKGALTEEEFEAEKRKLLG